MKKNEYEIFFGEIKGKYDQNEWGKGKFTNKNAAIKEANRILKMLAEKDSTKSYVYVTKNFNEDEIEGIFDMGDYIIYYKELNK